MEEIKFSDPMSKIRSDKSAEMFSQMADELMQSDEVQPQAKEVPTRTVAPTAQEKIKSSVPVGPKYMSALDSIMKVADIRSIETELPILKVKVEVSPLSGEEEMALKTAAVSPESFLKKIDELLFKHATFKDFDFKSYDDFLSNLYPPDKSMLIWALMTASYLVLPTLETICGECGERYVIEASPEEMFQTDTVEKVWDNPLTVNEYVDVQTVLDGYLTFEITMPSEKDRLIITKLVNPQKAKENMEKTGNILSYMDNLIFFTKSVVVGTDSERIVLTDVIQDIYPFLKSLPPKIQDVIKHDIDVDIFDKYMPRFYVKTQCTHCGAKEELDLDPELAFFRKAVSL